jgi:hypothetical protein
MPFTRSARAEEVIPSGTAERASTPSRTAADPGLVEIDAPDPHPAHLTGGRELLQQLCVHEGGVHRVKDLDEALHHPPELGDDLGELVQSRPAWELPGVVDQRLDAKDALAFGIDLQRSAPEVLSRDTNVCAVWRHEHLRTFGCGVRLRSASVPGLGSRGAILRPQESVELA